MIASDKEQSVEHSSSFHVVSTPPLLCRAPQEGTAGDCVILLSRMEMFLCANMDVKSPVLLIPARPSPAETVPSFGSGSEFFFPVWACSPLEHHLALAGHSPKQKRDKCTHTHSGYRLLQSQVSSNLTLATIANRPAFGNLNLRR